MNQPHVIPFLQILGSFSLVGAALALAGGFIDGNATAIAIGVTCLMEGAVLLGLATTIQLLFKISNRP